jgi:hypothetical protein
LRRSAVTEKFIELRPREDDDELELPSDTPPHVAVVMSALWLAGCSVEPVGHMEGGPGAGRIYAVICGLPSGLGTVMVQIQQGESQDIN